MKLKGYKHSLEDKMSEFDLWVTPTLGEIRDAIQFKADLNTMSSSFDKVASLTNNFSSVGFCSAGVLSHNTVERIKSLNRDDAAVFIKNICSVLFLVTGKTDNNLKCQFPIALKNGYGLKEYPVESINSEIRMSPFPRTIDVNRAADIVLKSSDDVFREKFLNIYYHLILSDEDYAKQLWSIGNAYCAHRKTGTGDSFLSPMVIFQSRGSITATQGHIPEEILREYMKDWGLKAGYDYNEQDVELKDILNDIKLTGNSDKKKRKFDFVLPYKSREDGAKLFIQSQFYAGDSGSVSHKVVDQTDSSRSYTLEKYPDAVFVEYLDGAGYYSSLNGDLRKMLAKETTKDFIQINSAPLKLRRDLQEIDFITPLEIEHAILTTNGTRPEVIRKLSADGYPRDEINNALNNAIEAGIISGTDSLALSKQRTPIIRKYCILDVIANYGHPVPEDKLTGHLLVPGYSLRWGMLQVDVVKKVLDIAPRISRLWEDMVEPFEDIQWLIEKGFVKTR